MGGHTYLAPWLSFAFQNASVHSSLRMHYYLPRDFKYASTPTWSKTYRRKSWVTLAYWRIEGTYRDEDMALSCRQSSHTNKDILNCLYRQNTQQAALHFFSPWPKWLTETRNNLDLASNRYKSLELKLPGRISGKLFPRSRLIDDCNQLDYYVFSPSWSSLEVASL